MTEPGEGTKPDAGGAPPAAPTTPPAGDAGAPATTKSLTPEQMAEVNARLALEKDAIRNAERERVKAEIAAEADRAKLSEQERLRADLDATTKKLQEVQTVATISERVAELMAASSGRIPKGTILEIVRTWSGDWNAAAALTKAQTETADFLKALGIDPGATPLPTIPGATGTPPPAMTGMTDQETVFARYRAGEIDLPTANKLWDQIAAAKRSGG